MCIITLVAIAAVLAGAVPAAGQSTDVESYALLAERTIRAKRLTMTAGDLGVIDPLNGRIMARNTLEAPESAVAAHIVRLRNSDSQCAQLFANLAVVQGQGCDDPDPFVSPFEDLATACGFPAPFPSCDPDAPPIVVSPGETRVLAPGTYGDVVIAGNPSGFGTLELAGDYQFCTLKASLDAVTVFAAASTVNVENALILSRATTTNPTIDAEDIRIFVRGTGVRISRNATVTAVICAPNATLGINSGAVLAGRFVAEQVRLKRNAIIGLPPSTTTSSSTTSSTATTLVPSSTTTTIGGTTTTTTIGSTTTTIPGTTTTTIAGTTTSSVPATTSTTTTPASTTSTTLVPATTTSTTTSSTTSTAPLVEICGNCIDDNLNGLTDFEDPACCSGSAGQVFITDLRRGKIKPRAADESLLKLRSILAIGSFDMDPAADDMQLQVRVIDGPEVLCTMLPPGSFIRKGQVFKFKNRDGSVAGAQNLRLVAVKLARSGEVRFKARGKRAQFTTPSSGALRITVGFRDPDGTDPPWCSVTEEVFRRTQKGALVFP
jgi:hypothetical protein